MHPSSYTTCSVSAHLDSVLIIRGMSIELPQCKSEEKGEKIYHLYTPRQPEI